VRYGTSYFSEKKVWLYLGSIYFSTGVYFISTVLLSALTGKKPLSLRNVVFLVFLLLGVVVLLFNVLFFYFITRYASTVGGLRKLLFQRGGFHLIRDMTILVLICIICNFVLILVIVLQILRGYNILEVTPSGMRWGYDLPVIVGLFCIQLGLSTILKKRDMGGSEIATTERNFNAKSTS